MTTMSITTHPWVQQERESVIRKGEGVGGGNSDRYSDKRQGGNERERGPQSERNNTLLCFLVEYRRRIIPIKISDPTTII